VEDFWTLRCEWSEKFREKLATLSGQQLSEVKRQALEVLRGYSSDQRRTWALCETDVRDKVRVVGHPFPGITSPLRVIQARKQIDVVQLRSRARRRLLFVNGGDAQ